MKVSSILSSVLFGLALIAAPAFASDEVKAPAKADVKAVTCVDCGKAADGKTTVEVGEKKVKVAVCCKDCGAELSKAKAEDVLKAVESGKALKAEAKK